MNRNAEHRLGAGKAALKPPALQTLRARPGPSVFRASVWSAGGFSAALVLAHVSKQIQGHKAIRALNP